MSATNSNVQWLNQNTNRAYPLRFDCSGVDTTGGFTLPHGLIADMSIYGVSGSAELLNQNEATLPTVYLSELTITTASVRFDFSIVASGLQSGGHCGAAAVSRSSKDYTTTSLGAPSVTQGFGTYAGNLTIGTMTSLKDSDIGIFRFLPNATTLEFSCVHFDIGRQRRMLVYQSGKPVNYVTGNIRLIAGQNIRFTPGANSLGISAASLDTLQPVCSPITDFWRFTTPIKAINGTPPNYNNGAFFLANDPCTEIKPTAAGNGLAITNKCATPCCTNDTLGQLTTDVENVVSSFTAMETLVNTLEKSLAQFESTVLASRSD